MFETLAMPAHTRSQSSPFSLTSRPISTSGDTPRGLRCRVAGGPVDVASRDPSLYEVLRVKHTASPVDIRTAYRRLAKLYHPDAAEKPPASKESHGLHFIQICGAFKTLSDPEARAVYDVSMGLNQRRVVVTSGSSSPWVDGRSGFYTTRSWESDQCW